ncbi:MAG: M20/M25/M40 family metallo-hydrolase [Planctomycetes bacterium]|nr:M20/M25/M40 family metallo-hydrolase [Planctomycetota bacterium]
MRNLFLLSLFLLCNCESKQATLPVEFITPTKILDEVTFLASDEMQGRYFRSNEARIAAKHIAQTWKNAGLVLLPNQNSMYLPIDDLRAAPNVAAMLQGTGNEFVLITAHYDHLKPRRSGTDKIYNGADDNASGTAALLVIAEALSKLQTTPEASIVLVAFTGEEAGFAGSKHFANTAPIPMHRIRALINLDMISRGEQNTIFLEGAPDAPRISLAISNANEKIGLRIIKNKHPDWIHRSDQAPFLEQGVPSVFLSVEDHEDYHRVTDHTEKILPGLAAKTAQLSFLAAIDLAGGVP